MSNQIDIKFVSYSGKYPTLCHGVLVLNVNGKNMRFGYEPLEYPVEPENKDNYPIFWESGGSVVFDEDWNDSVWSGKWEWSVPEYKLKELPKEIVENKDLVMKIFNENVPFGCCGGCV